MIIQAAAFINPYPVLISTLTLSLHLNHQPAGMTTVWVSVLKCLLMDATTVGHILQRHSKLLLRPVGHWHWKDGLIMVSSICRTWCKHAKLTYSWSEGVMM